MTGSSTPVLFLSGANLPAWIWDDVRAALPPGTESVVARSPGRGDASLADYAYAAADQAPWPTCAVVAHSSGGVVAAELLARRPGRVVGVLGVSALFPAAGRSMLRSLPFPAGLVLGAVLRVAGTRPPAKAVRTGLASGLPDAVVDRIVADLAPESPRLYRDACSPRELPAHRGYLATTRDRELSAATQRRAAETLAATWTEGLPTGHLPMLQDPAGTGRAVRRLLADVDG